MANYYESKPQFLSKGVVLCQPGLFCTEETYDPMWTTMRLIADSTTISINDEVLTADNIKSVSIRNALSRQSGIGKISFFKTLFRSQIGRIDSQAEELNTIINGVKNVFGENIPIFLVGYSKGGLVNMRYVTLYPGVVKNVTSIGTPYLNSFIQKAVSMADDVLGAPLYTIVGTKFDDSNHPGKTDLVLESMKKLSDEDKKHTLMVGDRYFDIDGAAGAGVDSVGVTYGYGSREEFKEHGATYIIDNAKELLKIVGE